MSDSVTDGVNFTGTVDEITLGESITIDGTSYKLAAAANLESEIEVGQYVEAIRDGDGMVTSVSTAEPPPPAPPPSPPARDSQPAPEPDPGDEYRMTLIEHLEELRERLIKSVIALFAATIFSLIFARQVLTAFEALLPGDAPTLQTHTPTEAYIVYFKVALMCGLAFSMPIIVYQFFAFAMPGLTRQERRWLYLVAPTAGILFVVGLLFAYFIVLPFGLPILQGFLSDLVLQQWRLDYYVSFVVRFLIITGLIFETPLVIFFLSKLGVVSHQRLAQSRRYAIVVAAAVAAVLTPTTDPFTMLLVMGPMLLLYELGVLLARFA